MLQAEREQYEENMKKAFMRGVCALNMEAMTMFSNENERTSVHKTHLPGNTLCCFIMIFVYFYVLLEGAETTTPGGDDGEYRRSAPAMYIDENTGFYSFVLHSCYFLMIQHIRHVKFLPISR